jgi:hypothetical protein
MLARQRPKIYSIASTCFWAGVSQLFKSFSEHLCPASGINTTTSPVTRSNAQEMRQTAARFFLVISYLDIAHPPSNNLAQTAFLLATETGQQAGQQPKVRKGLGGKAGDWPISGRR